MMKGKLKQLISILLISVLVLSMAAPGFAEETTGTTTPKVTVNSRTSGHTFELYQIFSGDIDTNDEGETVLTNIDWGDSVKKDDLIAALYASASDADSSLYETLKDIDDDVWTAAMDEENATDSDKQVLAYAVAKALSAVSDKTTEAYAFADLVCASSATGYLYLSGSAASTSTAISNDSDSDEYAAGYLYYYEMSGFASGYYVLMDEKDSLGYTDENQTLDTVSYTRYILGVIGDEVTVYAKADNPTIDKYIMDPDDSENLEKTEEYSIGDDITYQLNSAVPDMEGYTNYWFMAKDTLCEGLDFIKMDSVTVGGDDVSLAKTVYRTFEESDDDCSNPLTEKFYKGSAEDANNEVSSEEDITVGAGTYTLYWYEFYDTQGTDDTDDDVKTETKLYFVLNSFYDSYKNSVGDEILITYIVRLNENASIGEVGNDNTVELIYSNNPNDEYDGDPTPDTENNPTGGIGKTTTKKTVSYTSLIKLKKIDADDGTVLSGATFKLTGITSGTTTYYILETSEEYEYVEAADGEFVNANEFVEGATEAVWTDYVESLHSEYTRWTTVPVDSTYTLTTQEKENDVALTEASGTTGNDGYVIFEGLGEGVYKLEETSAPSGYNKLTEYIYIKIEYTDPDGFENATKTWSGDQPDTGDLAGWSYKYIISDTDPEDEDWEDAEIVIECNMVDGVEVINTSGVLLPSTGGVGTMVFTVAGLCAMAGAVIFLYTKRRREEQ